MDEKRNAPQLGLVKAQVKPASVLSGHCDQCVFATKRTSVEAQVQRAQMGEAVAGDIPIVPDDQPRPTLNLGAFVPDIFGCIDQVFFRILAC